ncbi:hypothetical protein GOBAR_DD03796 [Gossypium barbadense]|nr:hypothetical protein GOBAR_DD03796 [Gossypium barbadense]
MAGPPTKDSRPCSDISRRSFFNNKKTQVPLSFQRLTITHLIIGVLKVEGSRCNAVQGNTPTRIMDVTHAVPYASPHLATATEQCQCRDLPASSH